MTERQASLLEFLKMFPEAEEVPEQIEELSFPKPLVAVLEVLAEKDFGSKSMKKLDKSTAWIQYNKVLKVAVEFLQEAIRNKQDKLSTSSLKITKNKSVEDIESYIMMLIVYGVHCNKKKEIIGMIKNLPKQHQINVTKVIKEYSHPPKRASARAHPETPVKKEEAPAEHHTEKKEENKAEHHTEAKEVKAEEHTAAKHETPAAEEVKDVFKERLEATEKENAELEREIEEIKRQIEAAKKEKEEKTFDEQNSIESIAEINASLFQIKIGNDAKQQKVNKIKSNIEGEKKLSAERDQLKARIEELEHEIDDANSDAKIISSLNKKLQALNLDPQNDKISSIEEDIKKYATVIKKLSAASTVYKNKIEGSKNITALQDRLAFLKSLEETNNERKRRAELALQLSLKSLRCEHFQKEMRSVI